MYQTAKPSIPASHLLSSSPECCTLGRLPLITVHARCLMPFTSSWYHLRNTAASFIWNYSPLDLLAPPRCVPCSYCRKWAQDVGFLPELESAMKASSPRGKAPGALHAPFHHHAAHSPKYLQLLWGHLTLPWAVLTSGIISAAVSSSCPSCFSLQAWIQPARHRCCYGQQVLDSVLISIPLGNAFHLFLP